MEFVVKFREGNSPTAGQFPHVVLVQDNWDDYGYKTTFSATLKLSAEDELELGNLKILRLAQQGGYTPMPRVAFQSLGPDYCSLGGTLDYYELLFKQGRPIYRTYLEALGDVTFNDDIKARFEDLEGYKVSLLRIQWCRAHHRRRGAVVCARCASYEATRRRFLDEIQDKGGG